MESILITGANKGIGLQLVKKHIKRGDSVIAVCRTPSDEFIKSGAQIISNIDFLSDDFEQLLLEKLTKIKLIELSLTQAFGMSTPLTISTLNHSKNNLKLMY